MESDKSLEEDEIKTLAEKFDNIWIYQTDDEEKDKEEKKIKQLAKLINSYEIQLNL